MRFSINLKFFLISSLSILTFLLSMPLRAERHDAPHPHIMMGYWSYSKDYPIPGSVNTQGMIQHNQAMQDQLNYLNILAYAFLEVDANGIIHFTNNTIALTKEDGFFCRTHTEICHSSGKSLARGLGNFQKFSQLSNRSGNLKKLISLGGASDSQSLNSAIQHIPAFINSVAAMLDHYHLDGVDLDFESTAFTKKQAQGFATLVVALRHRLGSKALITIPVFTKENFPAESWKVLATHASYILEMCYDLHYPRSYSHYTGYNSNLYPDLNEPRLFDYPHLSCDQSIQSLISHGVPPSKIILGYPSYADVFNGVAPYHDGLFQRFDHRKKFVGPQHFVVHSLHYLDVLDFLNKGFQEHITYNHHQASGVWAYNRKTQQFFSYDNVAVIKEKVSYVNRHHLAGLMTWLINDDAPVTSQKSLLRAAHTGN